MVSNNYCLGAFCFLGFALIIIGGGSPYWSYVDQEPGNVAHFGPFTVCTGTTSVSTSDCSRIDPSDTDAPGRAIQAFTLMAIIFGLIGLIHALIHGCKGEEMKSGGAGIQAVASICGLVATALYVYYDTENHKCESIDLGGAELYTCYWAFGLFVAGWLVSLIISLLIFFNNV